MIVDCLRISFNEEIRRNGKECTLPWIESMSAIKYADNIKMPTCNNTRSVELMSSMGHRFSKQLAKYNITKCPGESISMLFIINGSGF